MRPTDTPDAPDVGRGGEAISAVVPLGVNCHAGARVDVPFTGAGRAAECSRPGGEYSQDKPERRPGPAGPIDFPQGPASIPNSPSDSGAQGEVVLTAIIGVDGKVKDVKVLEGHPLLRNAAVAAVKQWVYKPTLLNGKPVQLESRISLNFVPR